MKLRATDKSGRLTQTPIFHSLRGLTPLIALLALSGCGNNPSQPAAAAAAAPPVTVAQPAKRTVTEWDEFTGRVDAGEEVQARSPIGGGRPEFEILCRAS